MFQGLRQGHLFYILRKGDSPSLQVGQVTSVSNPTMSYGAFAGMIEVVVKIGENTFTFKQLATNESLHEYPNEGVIVSDNKDMMRNEVEGMLRVSSQVVDSLDYHKRVIESCDKMLRELNPQFAKEKEQEEKIGALEQKMNGMEGTLGDIREMLSKALGASSNNSKKQ